MKTHQSFLKWLEKQNTSSLPLPLTWLRIYHDVCITLLAIFDKCSKHTTRTYLIMSADSGTFLSARHTHTERPSEKRKPFVCAFFPFKFRIKYRVMSLKFFQSTCQYFVEVSFHLSRYSNRTWLYCVDCAVGLRHHVSSKLHCTWFSINTQLWIWGWWTNPWKTSFDFYVASDKNFA